MKYWVIITENVPLKDYSVIRFSGFVESERETCEEVKNAIVKYHKKQGKHYNVTVSKAGQVA